MFRRVAILWWRHARQETFVLAGGAFVLGFVTLVYWLARQVDARSTSDLEGIGNAILSFVPLFGLVLGHRMVVREYQAKTQLFVEALPLRRYEVVLAKFSFGFAAQLALVIPVLLLSAWGSGGATPRFFGILALRASGYVFSLWGLFFGMGLLGRLRVPAYLALGVGLFVLDTSTGMELARFGPFALIDPSSFPYERNVVPWGAFGQAVLAGGLFLTLGFALALLHEGSVAEVLSKRASAREVAGFWAIGFAGLLAVAWAAERREPEPFEFTGDHVLRSPEGSAEVMYAYPALEPKGRSLLSALDRLSGRLRDELGVAEHPPLRVAHHALLDGPEARAARASGSGVLLEVNLGFRGFNRERVLADVSHQLFLELSRNRAAFEPNHWFLDGFSAYWVSDPRGSAGEKHWLRAAVALRQLDASPEAIRNWERVMERVGEATASSVGFTLVELLERRHGRELTRGLARVLLARPTVENVIDWFNPHERDALRLFEARSGESWPRFIEAWRRELAERSRTGGLADRLKGVPDDRANLFFRAGSVGADLVYRLSGPRRDRARACALLHTSLEPYDAYVSPERLSHHRVDWAANTERFEGVLRGRYQSGQRVLAALDCAVPELAAGVRLTVARLEVP